MCLCGQGSTHCRGGAGSPRNFEFFLTKTMLFGEFWYTSDIICTAVWNLGWGSTGPNPPTRSVTGARKMLLEHILIGNLFEKMQMVAYKSSCQGIKSIQFTPGKQVTWTYLSEGNLSDGGKGMGGGGGGGGGGQFYCLFQQLFHFFLSRYMHCLVGNLPINSCYRKCNNKCWHDNRYDMLYDSQSL